MGQDCYQWLLSLTGGVRARYVKFKEFDDAGNKLKFDAGLTGIDIYFGAGLAIQYIFYKIQLPSYFLSPVSFLEQGLENPLP